MSNNRVSKKNLSEQVIIKIKDYIIDNNLKPGDRLPTEQVMTEEFGVSRGCVREATKALNFLGIIDGAPRRGLTVESVDIQRLGEFMGFHFALCNYSKEQLLRSRTVIEIGSFFYAMQAVIRDDDLYQKLLSLSEELENEKNVQGYIKKDTEFHRFLVKASGVEPLIAFNDLLHVFFEKFKESILLDFTKLQPDTHRAIVSALRQEKLEHAQKILQRHLGYYKSTL